MLKQRSVTSLSSLSLALASPLTLPHLTSPETKPHLVPLHLIKRYIQTDRRRDRRTHLHLTLVQMQTLYASATHTDFTPILDTVVLYVV